MNFLPVEEKFYPMFDQMARLLIEGADLLDALLRDISQAPRLAEQIKAVEHKADALTHDILTRLNKTFITPFDREDIHELSMRLDDVLDLIDTLAARTVLYKIQRVPPGMVELNQILMAQVREIAAACASIGRKDGILRHCVEINRLENDADRISRACIGTLFETETNPIELIKAKELYEVLESAIDMCEDVANVVETIVIKSA